MLQHSTSLTEGVIGGPIGAVRSVKRREIGLDRRPAWKKDGSSPRILVAATVPATIERFLFPLAKHHRNMGWQVDCMARGVSTSKGCREAFDACWEVGLSRNPFSPRNFVRTPGLIRQIVAEQKYDIVHVHSPVAAFMTRLVLRNVRRQLGTKVVYTAHGFHFLPGISTARERCFLALEKLAGRWTDRLVVINQEDYEQALRHHLVPPERLRHIPGVWLDKGRFNPGRIPAEEIKAIRAELGLRETEVYFLCAAEFSPVKRQNDIIHAFTGVPREGVHLVFAGDGSCRSDCAALAERLGLGTRTHFLGYRPDVPALMKASAAVVLASEREGLPSVVLEALSVGAPVIATAARGTRELVDGGCGLLVPIGSPPALASAMNFLLENPAAVRSMVDRGLRKNARYDSARTLEEYDRLYSELLPPAIAFARC